MSPGLQGISRVLGFCFVRAINSPEQRRWERPRPGEGGTFCYPVCETDWLTSSRAAYGIQILVCLSTAEERGSFTAETKPSLGAASKN
ncbi:hypothetical protein DPEC_G00171380 [Dallia pectoralis]|uniref:Uncharacterized protein n=1 Tax=Dallia pectoralis TaxID=75939 RepID=A0ACC2GD86_DALPE|nr:hypothetical protein DPEC_G00171380 [Dallia pectoralis]